MLLVVSMLVRVLMLRLGRNLVLVVVMFFCVVLMC